MNDHASPMADPNDQELMLPEMLETLASPLLDPLFWRAERVGEASAWWLHVPFAQWIVCAAEPRVLVELGTHTGVSYAAFCLAVQRAGLPTRCHAVDTWRGDDHAGTYDESVFRNLSEFHNDHFSHFSTLIRSTFDEALGFMEDRSIDLLHIDGFHTYEAVHHDFESWLPKLSDTAVVLFHDINERAGNFGAWRFWQEVCERYPNFTFLHGHGLGVLAVGQHPPATILALCRAAGPRQVARIRDRFARLGERWLTDSDQRALAQRYDAAMTELNRLRAQLATLSGPDVDTLNRQVAHLTEAHNAVAAERDQFRGRLARVEDLARVQRQEAEDHLARQRQEAEEQLARQRADLDAQAAAAAASLAAAAETAARQARAEAQLRDLAAQRTTDARRKAIAARAFVDASVRQAQAETQQARLIHEQFLASTAWRATWPLRSLGTRLPPSVRRAMRGGAKFAWWTLTMRLPSKLRQRQELVRHYAAIAAAPPSAPSVPPIPIAAPSPAPQAPATILPTPPPGLGRGIVYISGEPTTPGHLYRIERYMSLARANGVSAVSMAVEEILGRLDEIEAASALVIWRARYDDTVAAAIAAARRGGIPVVFDVDDLMIDPSLARTELIDGIRSQFLTEDMVRDHYSTVRQTMDAADLCFTTTEELAFHLRWAGKPTFVLPNGFDQSTHDISRRAMRDWRASRTDTLIRIGYAGGSRTHQRDLGLTIEAIARLLRENAACRLVLFRTPDGRTPLIDVEEYPALVGLEAKIEWRPLQKLVDLPVELARLDINLAPLEFGNAFCEAKSELKYFEAALVGVPTVASPTGPFRRAIDHGITGLLAASADEWYVGLKSLVDDPALRTRLAANAYHHCLATFGPLQRNLLYRRTLAQLRPTGAGADAFALAAHAAVAPRTAPRVYGSDLVFEHDRGGEAGVTVIVPLYNYENYIVEALDSVREQTLTPLDLVIVDGFSTDSSLAVALRWAKENRARFNRIAVLKNQANYGLAFCRNSGFDAARTPYVLPLDADNKLLPACCETLLRTIEGTTLAFVYPTIQHFGASSGLLSAEPWVPQRLVSGNFIDAMALVSKEAWAIVGGYDHVRFGWEDYDFWARLAEHGLSGQWQRETLALYRVHDVSMMQMQTLKAGNYRSLVENYTQRHPWVSLIDDFKFRQTTTPNPKLTDPAGLSRIDALLPILRCPDTGYRLTWTADRTGLVSLDGMRTWPVLNGRPILAAHLGDPVVLPDTHISNELPAEALALIHSTKGRVLNLSAGGSLEKFDHVVEVEYAIFRHTDLIADAHVLPFLDESFEAIVVMNAFEHYKEPHKVAAELRRILKPNGQILIRTAFMQPLHERPWHFFNCTRYGLAEWFKEFETEQLHVSSNFCPNHSIAWLASESEQALRSDVSAESAEAFKSASIGELVQIWRDPSRRNHRLWTDFEKLSQTSQEITAAGFEFLGRKPLDLPDLGKKPAA